MKGFSMIRRHFATTVLVAVLLALGSAPPRLYAAGPIQLDDPALPLPRGEAQTEAEADRLEAVSLFAAGRMSEQRQEMPAALRRYQRAFRLDPTAEPVLREIVPLAFSLGREEEAVRYATRLAELDASDPTLLRRLGVVLTEQEQYQQALALYEKVRQLETGRPKSAAHVVLHLEMGRLYMLTGKIDKAAEMLTFVSKALDAPEEYGLDTGSLKTLTGEKGEVHELMAAAFLETGKTDEAAKSFARLEKFRPDKAISAYNRARVAAQAGRHDEALASLQEYFDARQSSRGVAPYELLAKVLREQQRADEVIPRLEKLFSEQEENVPLNLTLAEEYFQKKEWEKALARYQVAQSSRPSALAYRRLLSIYRQTDENEKLLELLGELLAKTGSLEIVEDEFESLVEDKPRVEAVVKLAADKFGEPKAEHHDVLHAAGLLALEAKLYGTAGDLLELAIKAKPADKAQVLLRHGLALLVAERFSDAARVFQRGIDEKALPENNPAFYFYLAGALAMDGKTDEALRAAGAAAEKKTDDPRYDSRIPWIYYHAKRYDEAAKHYRELLKKYQDNYDSPEVRSVVHDTRLILSNIAVLQDNLPEAEEWIEQVLDEFPDDVGGLNDLGYLWADQNKRLERAHRMIRRAVAAEPENAAYRDSLGWVLYRLGRYAEALVEQKKAVELAKTKDEASDGVMYDHLADIHAALGQKDEAQAAWREAAAAFEKTGDKEKLEAVNKKMQ
jgi:tetratricopeptide (TPR) repeat protein